MTKTEEGPFSQTKKEMIAAIQTAIINTPLTEADRQSGNSHIVVQKIALDLFGVSFEAEVSASQGATAAYEGIREAVRYGLDSKHWRGWPRGRAIPATGDHGFRQPKSFLPTPSVAEAAPRL